MVFQIHLEMNVGAQASDGKKNARGCGVGGTEFTLRQAPFDPWKSGANGRLRANGEPFDGAQGGRRMVSKPKRY